MRQIILASTSPRRKQLLQQAGIEFTVVPSNFEEDMTLPLAPSELVKQLALGKANEVAEKYPDAIVIGADTIVVLKNQVLGKPKDEADARKTLQKLSGTTNEVITGMAVLCASTNQKFLVASSSTVFMAEISETELDDYIASGEPMDKAGSYAAQGAGSIFVERIEGDFTSVIGLSVSQVWRLLKQIS
jgi:septum formation protein